MRNEVLGCNLDGLLQKPLGEKFNSVCRRVAAEGIVLLKNENKVLPLKKGSKVSVFGRIQDNYIRSGTGSGGLVNVEFMLNGKKQIRLIQERDGRASRGRRPKWHLTQKRLKTRLKYPTPRL